VSDVSCNRGYDCGEAESNAAALTIQNRGIQ